MIFGTVRLASRHELAENQPRRTARSLYTKIVIRTPGKAPHHSGRRNPESSETASSNIGHCLFHGKERDGLPSFLPSPTEFEGLCRLKI